MPQHRWIAYLLYGDDFSGQISWCIIVGMKTLTINLPDDLERRLQELSNREQRSPEDTVCEIIRKRLSLNRFHDLCRESEPLAKAAGFKSEDDVLRAIS